jgi:hypothetical protein
MSNYNKNIIKIFYNFLIKRKIYDSYIKNFYCANYDLFTKENVIDFLANTIRGKDEESLIGCAFTWSRTEEGRNFWYEIDKKWREYLEKYQDKIYGYFY